VKADAVEAYFGSFRYLDRSKRIVNGRPDIVSGNSYPREVFAYVGVVGEVNTSLCEIASDLHTVDLDDKCLIRRHLRRIRQCATKTKKAKLVFDVHYRQAYSGRELILIVELGGFEKRSITCPGKLVFEIRACNGWGLVLILELCLILDS
jgi:hypothetical protein